MGRHREWAQMAILHWDWALGRGNQEESLCTHTQLTRLKDRKGRCLKQFSIPKCVDKDKVGSCQ
jgi:hypothetical protein